MTLCCRAGFHKLLQFKARLDWCEEEKKCLSEPRMKIKRTTASPTRAGIHAYLLWFHLTLLINIEKSWKAPVWSCDCNLSVAEPSAYSKLPAPADTLSSRLIFFPIFISYCSIIMALISVRAMRTVYDININDHEPLEQLSLTERRLLTWRE